MKMKLLAEMRAPNLSYEKTHPRGAADRSSSSSSIHPTLSAIRFIDEVLNRGRKASPTEHIGSAIFAVSLPAEE